MRKRCICGLAEVLSPQITKSWIRKSQIHIGSHLPKVSKSNKLFKSANLRVCDLRNLLADRPHLVTKSIRLGDERFGVFCGVTLYKLLLQFLQTSWGAVGGWRGWRRPGIVWEPPGILIKYITGRTVSKCHKLGGIFHLFSEPNVSHVPSRTCADIKLNFSFVYWKNLF